MSTEQLRACHSDRSPNIIYNPNRPECRSCPLKQSCATSAARRRSESKSSSTGTRQRKGYSTSTSTTKPVHYYNHNVLDFDPNPDKDETIFERVMWNLVSAGTGAILQEGARFARSTKFGVRTHEHNRRAKLNRNALQRDLEVAERQDAELERLHKEAGRQNLELARMREKLKQLEQSEQSEQSTEEE